MNQENNQEVTHSFSSNKFNSSTQVQVDVDVLFDEFNISEDSFKPMTKGLGFHQEQKRSAFTPALKKESKPFLGNNGLNKSTSLLNTLSEKSVTALANHGPSGLEIFYNTKGTPGTQNIEDKKIDLNDLKIESKPSFQTAGSGVQFIAWLVDLLVVASFVAVTGTLLVFASGIQYKMFARLISTSDLVAFSSAIFSIYYLLYFTILDLTASPGKTIMGIRLLKSNNSNVTVKDTFTRSLVSLFSVIALFLPMLLDFQGRLSDTKLVK